MNLQDLVATIGDRKDQQIICARRPWRLDCEAVTVESAEDVGVPKDAIAAGFEYFLEVSVAKEVLGVFDYEPTPDEATNLLIYYAENDAYPQWVYD